MIKQFLVALSAVQTVKVSSVYETCDFNIQRLEEASKQEIFSKNSNTGSQFKDSSFPASSSSLFWKNHISKDQDDITKTFDNDVSSWIRPKDLFKTTLPSLWGSKLNPIAATTGVLDDSWFLGSAAAMAEQPSRIQKLFRNSEYSKDGIFEVIFNLRDQHVHMVVDDRLPVDANNELVNARPVSKESGWWLVLLEKAYAKLNVNYANLHHGSPVEALKELTGMPVV